MIVYSDRYFHEYSCIITPNTFNLLIWAISQQKVAATASVCTGIGELGKARIDGQDPNVFCNNKTAQILDHNPAHISFRCN